MQKAILFLALAGLLIAASVQAQDLEQISKTKPVTINGGLSAGTFAYFSRGIENRQSPFGYSLSGNVNINIYGVSLPFYASINDQQTSFQQPFTRFGVSPKYKWIQLHAGWRTLDYSQFSLSNMNFLGGGLDLTPGLFRFSAMRGILKQSTLLGDINFGEPQFERKATAFKLGFGTSENFVDLIGFRAADDLASLQLKDSTAMLVPAQENLVVGVKNHLTLIKNRVTFDLDVAGSAFTSDVRADTLPIPGLNTQSLSGVFTPRLSSSANYAGESSLNFRLKRFSVSAKYRRVMPEYYSLGSEYILNDLEAVTLNPGFALWQGKVAFSGSAGWQRNNLDHRRVATNNRTIASVNVSVQPSANYGISLNYSNYSFQQQVILDSIYTDSLVVNQLNHNLMAVPRLMFTGERFIHTVLLTTNFQLLDDQNPAGNGQNSNQMVMANLMYSVNRKSSGLSLNTGLNYFDFQSGLVNLVRYGINLGFNVTTTDKKWILRFNSGWNNQVQADEFTQYLLFNGGLSYQAFDNTSFQLNGSFTNSKSVALPYSETRVQFSVLQTFE